jgi:tRNA/tmRNA/rRNA uracil-C5-methylase (TrmA/RlmC/RlmD family)
MRTVELTIESVAFGGKGVARDNGKTVFVPFTIDGETITVNIVREKKQFAEAELIDILERSPHRVDPPCPYFGRCGGCAYQHIAYEHQLAIKWRQVGEVLRRIGKIKDMVVRPIIPSPAEYGYRNRITVHAENGITGYFRRDSHRLIDVERCPIADEEVNRELKQLRLAHPRDGHYTLRAHRAPRIFAQTNDAVGSALRDLVVKLTPDNQTLLIEAYCGSGFFVKALRAKFDRIIGIDWDRFAIEEAQKDAGDNETYVAGNVEDGLAQVAAVHTPSPRCSGGAARTAQGQSGSDRLGSIAPASAVSTIIVDPPATGLTRTICKRIIDLAPNNFIYVSCNPATLARDLIEFRDQFEIESVTPLDMFPQTAEIEVVAHLRCAKF